MKKNGRAQLLPLLMSLAVWMPLVCCIVESNVDVDALLKEVSCVRVKSRVKIAGPDYSYY